MREYAVRRGRILQHIVGPLFCTTLLWPLTLSLVGSPLFSSRRDVPERASADGSLASPNPECRSARCKEDRSDCPRPTSMTRKDNNTTYCRRSFMFRQCWQTVVGPEPPKSARNWPHTTRLFQRVLVHCS